MHVGTRFEHGTDRQTDRQTDINSKSYIHINELSSNQNTFMCVNVKMHQSVAVFG